nr:hypothetical protein [Armatimonadota bacterium]
PPGWETQALNADLLVRVIEQKLNPDHPRSQPKGSTGRGFWLSMETWTRRENVFGGTHADRTCPPCLHC